MHLEEAIKIIRDKGYVVNRWNRVYLVMYPKSREPDEYTPREIVMMAKQMTEHNHSSMRKDLKQDRKEKNRHATKQDISLQLWDNFDKNKLRRDSNPWNHD